VEKKCDKKKKFPKEKKGKNPNLEELFIDLHKLLLECKLGATAKPQQHFATIHQDKKEKFSHDAIIPSFAHHN